MEKYRNLMNVAHVIRNIYRFSRDSPAFFPIPQNPTFCEKVAHFRKITRFFYKTPLF